MAVVKADAYGHGAIPCARVALDSGTDYLGVGIIEEGIELRESGINIPILILGGIFPDEIEDLIRYNLSTTVSTSALAETLSNKAKSAGKIVGVHLKLDTGMGRLGILPEDFLCLAEHILSKNNLILEGLCTHFASADEDPEFTKNQIVQLDEAYATLNQAGYTCPLVHCANSSAILNFKESWKDMVRPGLLLYGALRSPKLKSSLAPGQRKAWQPVMQWKSKIGLIKNIPKNTPLSYSGSFLTKRQSRIATLPIGYADGLLRNLSNKIDVLVKGQRVPQVGNICMDFTLIDVTDIPDVALEDEVVIFGKQGNEMIVVEEIAEKAATLPYEILCAVGKRVPRVYIN